VDRAIHTLGWATVAKRFEPIGAKLRDLGFVLAYHNHNFEFALENGKPGLDVLYEAADPALLKAQIDAYWVLYGGGDPASYIRKLKGRVPLVHLKDGKKGGPNAHFLEVGQGDVDWDDVLAACKESEVDFGAIEQDSSERDSMESARMSVEFLRARGISE
jgi:sugar phosphate isomerase/epimerase